MKVLFFIILTMFLMILQSIVLPNFLWFDQSFDLLIVDILFLSLIASRHTVIFAVIGIGCIMDSVSGVPFSYHVFAYLWIYIMVSIVRLLLFDQSVVFVLIISLVSVIIQQVLLLFSIFINQGGDYLLTFEFDLLVKQTFWGFLFIPLSIWVLNIFWVQWNFMTKLMHKRFVQHHNR
jgi:hypothetical protein